MFGLFRHFFRFVLGVIILVMMAKFQFANHASAATYAAVVMDARNGQILHSENADLRLHPASLTKMMTVYVAIQAVENGEIDLDTKVKISKFAASEAPSKIHLKPGSRVKLRHLIRAAAVRSANDAATAIAEAISGSEKAFAARMNRTARAMGLTKTTFKNAHGLTQNGHLSSARDMTILGRHVVYDYPEYYHLFSKSSADVGGGLTVRNTNRRFLRQSKGADGIKTGFTNAAGFCLTASAQRGDKRIIVTVFGGRSGSTRDAHVAKLMDRGFLMAQNHVTLNRPAMPQIPFGKLTRIDTTVALSARPVRRPSLDPEQPTSAVSNDTLVTAINEAIETDQDEGEAELFKLEPLNFARPVLRPHNKGGAMGDLQPATGIVLGTFNTNHEANKRLSEAMVMEFRTLGLARKFVRKKHNGFEAGYTDMSQNDSQKACTRLAARKIDCQLYMGR